MGGRGTHFIKGQNSRTRFKMNTVYKEFFGYARDSGSMTTRQQKRENTWFTWKGNLDAHFLLIVTLRACS